MGSEVADINMVVPIDRCRLSSTISSKRPVDNPPRPQLGAFPPAMASDRDERVGGRPGAGGMQGDLISDVRDTEAEGLGDFYRKLWASGPAGAEVPMRIVRDGRETWLRVKTADRSSFLRKPQLQ